ncbi:hypothetical protein [Desulfobacula phenolica]|uniref:Uncharacterized protein n=1 Tax=Desulfobacula phenolica TaxID=90732 RepID=A0A1H2E3I9_9BACT|nr:hypothetical protein [Desulfobacula phenolica]SDT89615.1 hypothetical protein SAMN04487931_102463 [Desulfobacula phenolica]
MNTAPKLSDPYNTKSGGNFSIPKKFNKPNSDDSLSDFNNDYNQTDIENEPRIAPPKIVPEYLKPLKGRYQLLQLWEGRVTEVSDDTFYAIISDKTNPELSDELVSMDIEEITPSDLSLLTPGAVFYWSISYADFPGRGRKKESKIRFRRLPLWTHKEIKKAINTGAELAAFFKKD